MLVQSCKQSRYYDPLKIRGTDSKVHVNSNAKTQPGTDAKVQQNLNIQNQPIDSKGKNEVSVVLSDNEDLFEPYKFCGKVSLGEGSHPIDITILRDTGANQSILVGSCLPGIEKALTEEKTLVRDFTGLSLSFLAIIVDGFN